MPFRAHIVGRWAFCLVAIGLAAFLCLSPEEPKPSIPTPAGPGLDVDNPSARLTFAGQGSGEADFWPNSLTYECEYLGRDTYRVVETAWFRLSSRRQVELRADGAFDAQVSRRRFDHEDLESRRRQVSSAPTQFAKASREDLLQVGALADRLVRNRIPLVFGQSGTDGTVVTVEFCKDARYHFYALLDFSPGDAGAAQIQELANAVLHSGNEAPIDSALVASLPRP